VHQLKQELIREKQTSLTFLLEKIEANNQIGGTFLPRNLKSELGQVDAIFERLSLGLRNKKA